MEHVYIYTIRFQQAFEHLIAYEYQLSSNEKITNKPTMWFKLFFFSSNETHIIFIYLLLTYTINEIININNLYALYHKFCFYFTKIECLNLFYLSRVYNFFFIYVTSIII